MNPLEPNDPLWKLLGQARPVEQRGNFTQKVLRAVRNVPQDHGWLAQIRAALADGWAAWQRPALLAVVTAVVVLGAVVIMQPSNPSATSVVTSAPSVTPAPVLADDDMALIADDFELPLTGLDHMDALVAMDDTTALTDTEIAYLLY